MSWLCIKKNIKHRFQNRSKIDQKSIQNRSKIDPKSITNRFPKRTPFFITLGKLILAFWGPSGGQVGLMLATFSEVFELPRRSLKEVRFQDDFEAILKRFGSLVGKQKRVFRCRGASVFNFLSPSVFPSIFHRFWRPKWSQNRAKIESKSVCKSFKKHVQKKF